MPSSSLFIFEAKGLCLHRYMSPLSGTSDGVDEWINIKWTHSSVRLADEALETGFGLHSSLTEKAEITRSVFPQG